MKVRRFLSAIAGAAALSIGLSGVVAADNVVGQHGNYQIDDSLSTPGAACRYASTSPNHIYKIVVRAPSVWWPDTNATNNNQYGPVGWQAFVYHKGSSATTWKLLKKSSVQHKTAHEDHPAYDSNDKAPFTNITLYVAGNNYGATHEFKVRVKLFWYSKVDGHVLGSVGHDVVYYRFGSGSTDVTYPTCHAAV